MGKNKFFTVLFREFVLQFRKEALTANSRPLPDTRQGDTSGKEKIPMENMEQTERNTPSGLPQAPERRHREPAPRPGFLAGIGKDVRWYLDIRLWSPVLLALLVLCTCTGSKLGASGTAREYETVIQEMEEEWEEEREEQRRQEAQDAVPEPEPTAAPIDPEAEALATLADVVGAGRSDNVKTVIMWIAINRSENAIEGHGKSLIEEINMPLQWQGYDPEQTYTYSQETYDLAVEVLETRDSGGLRPVDGNMMWLVLNNNGSITIRNKYQGQNIYEKTIQ